MRGCARGRARCAGLRRDRVACSASIVTVNKTDVVLGAAAARTSRCKCCRRRLNNRLILILNRPGAIQSAGTTAFEMKSPEEALALTISQMQDSRSTTSPVNCSRFRVTFKIQPSTLFDTQTNIKNWKHCDNFTRAGRRNDGQRLK